MGIEGHSSWVGYTKHCSAALMQGDKTGCSTSPGLHPTKLPVMWEAKIDHSGVPAKEFVISYSYKLYMVTIFRDIVAVQLQKPVSLKLLCEASCRITTPRPNPLCLPLFSFCCRNPSECVCVCACVWLCVGGSTPWDVSSLSGVSCCRCCRDWALVVSPSTQQERGDVKCSHLLAQG